MSSINWSSLRDRHISAITEFGPAWIRTNKEGYATALYTKWDGSDVWEKYIPADMDESTLDGIKTYAELLIEKIRNTPKRKTHK